jgi:hypothetical protein
MTRYVSFDELYKPGSSMRHNNCSLYGCTVIIADYKGTWLADFTARNASDCSGHYSVIIKLLGNTSENYSKIRTYLHPWYILAPRTIFSPGMFICERSRAWHSDCPRKPQVTLSLTPVICTTLTVIVWLKSWRTMKNNPNVYSPVRTLRTYLHANIGIWNLESKHLSLFSFAWCLRLHIFSWCGAYMMEYKEWGVPSFLT